MGVVAWYKKALEDSLRRRRRRRKSQKNPHGHLKKIQIVPTKWPNCGKPLEKTTQETRKVANCSKGFYFYKDMGCRGKCSIAKLNLGKSRWCHSKLHTNLFHSILNSIKSFYCSSFTQCNSLEFLDKWRQNNLASSFEQHFSLDYVKGII